MIIPVIGTTVVKEVKWVKRLYQSIDFPVENFYIINNNGLGEIDNELNELKKIEHKFVSKLHISHMPSNLGVSTSWNLIIKSFINAPYWIITNDDVAFLPGLLEEICTVAKNKEVGMIHPYSGDFELGAWDLFLIKDWVIKSHGLFDENLYPAYCEDADYIMRLQLHPVEKVVGLNKQYLHGEGLCNEYYQHGSQTKKSSQDLTNKLESINIQNFDYLNKKWGEGWRTCQPQTKLFSLYDDIKITTWDLGWVRSKWLGF